MPPKLTHAPRNPTRRTREERQALDRAEGERRQARAEASAASAAAEAATRRPYYGHGNAADERWRASATRGHGLGGSLKYVRGGRGGFIGDRPQRGNRSRGPRQARLAPAAAAAPVFAQQTSGTEARATGSQRRRGRATAQDGDILPVVKTDPDSIAPNPVQQPKLKHEDEFGYGSSDEEAELGKNIDHITISSDEEQERSDADGDTNSDDRDRSRRSVNRFRPLRIPRNPHIDRHENFGVDIFSSTGSTRKDTKGKARRESGAGVAQDGEEAATVKRDPEVSRVAYAAGPSEPSEDEDEEVDQEPAQEQATDDSEAEGTSPTAAKNHSQRRASRASTKRPIFITEQDRLEHVKQQRDLEDIRKELGDARSMDEPVKNTTKQATTDSTTANTEPDEPIDQKAGAVYLFQLPPIVPDLIDESTARQKPASPQGSKKGQAQTSIPTGSDPTTAIKVEDNDPNADGAGPTRNLHRETPNLTPGLAGQLRIRKSGRATLTWGGTSMEVGLGINPHFLQTVVMADVPEADIEIGPGADRQNEHGGMDVDGASRRPEVVSFGQIRGKFIVTPDWNELLG